MKRTALFAAALSVALLLTACAPLPGAGPVREDLDLLTEEYLTPAVFSAITARSWEDPMELSPDQLVEFYAIRELPAERDLRQADTVPAEQLEEYVQQYFDVPSEVLRRAESYDAGQNCYELGYFGDPGRHRVVDARQEGDRLLLDYEYYSRADDSTVIRRGTLELRKTGEGSWQYRSCATGAVPEVSVSRSEGESSVTFRPAELSPEWDTLLYADEDAGVSVSIRLDGDPEGVCILAPEVNTPGIRAGFRLDADLGTGRLEAAYAPGITVAAELSEPEAEVTQGTPVGDVPAEAVCRFAAGSGDTQRRYRLTLERNADGTVCIRWDW